MLGLEFFTDFVVPKILFLDNDALNMFYLKQLKLDKPNDVRTLVKLVITFTKYVQCYEPQPLTQ